MNGRRRRRKDSGRRCRCGSSARGAHLCHRGVRLGLGVLDFGGYARRRARQRTDIVIANDARPARRSLGVRSSDFGLCGREFGGDVRRHARMTNGTDVHFLKMRAVGIVGVFILSLIHI